MKKIIVSLILISVLCIPFGAAYAFDMLYEDFESELDTSKWTADFRPGPEAGIIKLEDGNNVMHAKGTFNPRTEANIAAGKDYRHALLRPVNLNIGQTSPFRMSFDINITDLGEGSDFYIYFTSGTRRYIFMDFNSACEVKTGHYARLVGSFNKGEWYNVTVDYKAELSKPFTVTFTSLEDESSVSSVSFTLDRIFNASIITQFQANGINLVDFVASGVGAEDDESRVEVYYDNIRVEKTPAVTNAVITGDSIAGRTLTVSYDIDATYDEDGEREVVEWYAKKESSTAFLDEGSSYTVNRADADWQIYAKITPKDRSGYVGEPIVTEPTEVIKTFTARPNEGILKQEIEFEYPVDIETFEGAVSVAPASGGESIFPISVGIKDDDKKVVSLEFSNDALDYDTDYVITLSKDAMYMEDEDEGTVSCGGENTFKTRLEAGIEIEEVSGEKKEGLIFLSTVKLSTKLSDYKGLSVYADLYRNGIAVKRYSFLADIDKNKEYVLRAGFFTENDGDKIKWSVFKGTLEMSDLLTVDCEEAK